MGVSVSPAKFWSKAAKKATIAKAKVQILLERVSWVLIWFLFLKFAAIFWCYCNATFDLQMSSRLFPKFFVFYR